MNKFAKYIFILMLPGFVAGLASPRPARAQGSRKDDIVFNAQGRPMAGATVRICTSGATGQPCSPLASVYSDSGLTQALANPLSADGMGNYTFYAAPGRYEIEISGPGITTKQLPNVILPSDPSTPTFTTVTTTSGISAFSLSLTGNLTVSGSTAVAGSLTVGGSQVPSTGGDNQWTAGQRFKGPIPWRDITAYMPAGGCSSTNTGDPPATGTISSGSASLAVSSAADFKNGCGIAVIGAGPTATLQMASTSAGTAQICANPPSCSTHTGTNVAFTVGSGSIPLIPGYGNGSDAAGAISVTGCANSTYNVTTQGWILNFNNPVTMVVYSDSAVSGGTSTTGCTATFYGGWAHGTTGSTTYNYKVAPIDAKGGLGPAIGPITITNGNASISPFNYNYIAFQGTPGARMFAIYSDKGLGGGYSCVNLAYSMGFVDWGNPLPFGCPPYVPATPPASATAENLNTTIASGGGTTSLTLAAAASNTATAQNVFDDATSFLTSCVNDVVSDQGGAPNNFKAIGSYGCYIPYGRWPFNADMPTDTVNATTGGSNGVNIWVAGTPLFQTWPWMIGPGYSIRGMGATGTGIAQGLNIPSTMIERGTRMPAGAILRGNNMTLENLSFPNMQGNAAMVTTDPSSGAVTAGVRLRNLYLNVQIGFGTGVPLLVDNNTLYLWADNVNFSPNTTSGAGGSYPASILFTHTGYCSNGHAGIYFNNIFTQQWQLALDAPGGSFGQGTTFDISGSWESEEHFEYGTVILDSGNTNGVPGCANGAAARLSTGRIENFDNADAASKNLLYVLGQNSAQAFLDLNNAPAFNPLVKCDPSSPDCANGNVSLTLASDSTQVPNGQFVGTNLASPFLVHYPALFGEVYGQTGTPNVATEVPAPRNLTVTGTGSGSLSAGTYCFVVEGYDMQAAPGHTMPSPEVCQTVGASSSISLQWQLVVYDEPTFRIFYGPAGAEANYFTVNSALSTNQTYTFSTTTGASTGAPDFGVVATAYESWLNTGFGTKSCLLCVPANAAEQLGIGEPSPPAGDALSVKGGVLDAESGFKSALTTKSANYTLAVSDDWVNVTGTTTITVPHASTGNHWVVFNSGSGTVTVQADNGNINGAASITISANSGREIACDGTNCFAH